MVVIENLKKIYTCKQSSSQIITNGAIAINNGIIKWLGDISSIPPNFQKVSLRYNAKGSIAIPGLIDCHTHLCFAGWREKEFKDKALGKDYLQIAKEGGGIISTVTATRNATFQYLVDRCSKFLQNMLSLGITTVECKSGYGLTEESELKILRVYQELQNSAVQTIIPTLLAAHTLPPEFKNNRKEYLKTILNIATKAKEENLAEFFDIFIEDTAFTEEEADFLLSQARSIGFKLKAHCNQFTSSNGASIAASLGAVSIDHLETISQQDINMIKNTQATAVILPYASLMARQPPVNARRFIENNIPVAIATDFNPGTAPTYHLPFILSLSCILNKLTPYEALLGATYNAAKAIAKENELGSLEIGKWADITILNTDNIDLWLYHLKESSVKAVFKKGELVYEQL